MRAESEPYTLHGTGVRQELNIEYTASIVLYNTPASLLFQVVKSLREDLAPARLYLIDNSPSRLPEDIQLKLDATYLWTGENPGYGGGHNIAIQKEHRQSAYHLILNPDLLVHPGTMMKLLDFMEKTPDAGIAVPHVKNPDGTTQHLNKRYPSVLDLAIRFLVRGKLLSLFRKRMSCYEMHDIGYDKDCEPDVASGAFMLCRMTALRAAGYFDTGYFMYFEDFDLCRTVKTKGFRVVFKHDATVTHFWERASHKKLSMALTHISSACRYFRKWGVRWY